MGDVKGFLKVKRLKSQYRPVCERVKDYEEVSVQRPDSASQEQSSRCMDCGTPFCHWGCPIGNYIPEWNDFVFKGRWKEALALLAATNNFPEFTGRVCPAPCEYACVLGINDDPVTVRENELSIIEHAYKHGLIKATAPSKRTGKSIAVIGSGPSGLATADQLNRAGHKVTVYERDEKVGGILRFGIPDFKLDKKVIDRRVKLMEKEGVKFVTGINVGEDITYAELKKKFDAVCLTGGSRTPRDMSVEGRELKGIYFAMDYLMQSNRKVSGSAISKDAIIDAKGKKVVVIGGGDTGSDCVGTALRQGADCVVQIEVLPKPSDARPANQPWPKYPNILKTSSSHEEGCERMWSVSTKKFVGKNGVVTGILCEHEGKERTIPADMVVLAMGFLHPEHVGLLDGLKIEYDQRGNIKTGSDFMTSKKGVFSAGDMRRGQSLVVWAISEGRRAAYNIDKFLMGKSDLPII
jgi:glutamate synthase (NADPH) small chain